MLAGPIVAAGSPFDRERLGGSIARLNAGDRGDDRMTVTSLVHTHRQAHRKTHKIRTHGHSI